MTIRARALVVGAGVAPVLLALCALTGPGASAQSESPATAAAPSVEDLRSMSLEQLAQVQVTSVDKRPESLSDAPASIYVITHDEIMRSGRIKIPDILRLAPNLEVMQVSASDYVITARGFNGSSQAQSFTDKLLVLIDGRSVYTPLYSGVYWDMQDIPPEDIDRIEVISGPGATLWGANAVNGVINIITRRSQETQGLQLDAGAGDFQRSATVQYGGRIGAAATFRIYATDTDTYDSRTPTGGRADDHWSKPQGGFRLDWAVSPSDSVTFQGDGYAGAEAQAGAPSQDISGANVLGRWNHAFAVGDALQVQAYYDRTQRGTPDGGGNFVLDTYDVDIQDSLALGARNALVLGGGERTYAYTIQGTSGATSLLFVPSARTLELSNVFAQDTFSITRTLKLIGGLKLEDDPYSGLSPLPDLRLSWKPVDDLLLWAAVSRAIRSPTPFDRDVEEKLGSITYVLGDPDFRPEKLTAYELGLRAQPTGRLSVSLSLYDNDYDDLRTLEPTPGSFIPIDIGNGLEGVTYGLEAWGDYRVTDWWRLSASVDAQAQKLRFKPDASGFLGVGQDWDDPSDQASLKSAFNLARDITFDADLRYVGALPDPYLPSYVELDGSVSWALSPHLRLSLSGLNLLHSYHQEYPGAGSYAVPRSVFAEVRSLF